MKNELNIDEIGKRAAVLSSIEIGLGSLVHGLKIPLGGHLLALNQGFILTRAAKELKDSRAPSLISTTSALLKSLSPAGQKLTPMLAISAQGQLFTLGTSIAGNNIVGHMIGMTLLSFWGFFQPLAIYLIIFGKELVSMASFYLKIVNEAIPVGVDSVIQILIGLVALKIILGLGVVLLAHRMKPIHFMKFERFASAQSIKPRANHSSPWMGALKDLTHPIFLASFAFMILFFIFSNSPKSELIWLCLRPIAIAFVVFLLIRIFPVEKLALKLKKSHPSLGSTLEVALRHIK